MMNISREWGESAKGKEKGQRREESLLRTNCMSAPMEGS